MIAVLVTYQHRFNSGKTYFSNELQFVVMFYSWVKYCPSKFS
jgi:hypothetical protein